MSYALAVEQLYQLGAELAPTSSGAPRRKFDLDEMRRLAAALGNPQSTFPSVLIAGTNGKGSTAAMLANVLSTAGYRTGLYTSPHLQRVNERIQLGLPSAGQAVSFEPIDDARFSRIYLATATAAARLVADGNLPQMPSFFEVLTSMAFLAFAEAEVEIAVLEVGMGGRLDATNIVDPILSVITDISLDHTEWLGSTLSEIAREKAGILRPSGVMVTLPQHPEVNTALGEVAIALGVNGINAATFLPDQQRDGRSGAPYEIEVNNERIQLEPALKGSHQQRNVALAVATVLHLSRNEGFNRVTPDVIRRGVASVRWPGRLEQHRLSDGKRLLLDAGHNPAGMWALRSFLSHSFAREEMPPPRTLIFSAYRDKAVAEMMQILFPLFDGPSDRILLVPMTGPRAADGRELLEKTDPADGSISLSRSVDEALTFATSGEAGSIVVTGSVHLIGAVHTWLDESTLEWIG